MAKTKQPNTAQVAEGETIKVALQVDCYLGKAGAVVVVDKSELLALVGVADPHPSAVEYAESQAVTQ